LNIYDKRQISCTKCGKCIGEIDYDAEVVNPRCAHCANPLPDGFEKLSYSIHRIKNMPDKKIISGVLT
jgi:hypothetical protein